MLEEYGTMDLQEQVNLIKQEKIIQKLTLKHKTNGGVVIPIRSMLY